MANTFREDTIVKRSVEAIGGHRVPVEFTKDVILFSWRNEDIAFDIETVEALVAAHHRAYAPKLSKRGE